MKEINLKINKTDTGYVVTEENLISFFTDDDQGRKMLIDYLIKNLLNKEVEGGRLYFRGN